MGNCEKDLFDDFSFFFSRKLCCIWVQDQEYKMFGKLVYIHANQLLYVKIGENCSTRRTAYCAKSLNIIICSQSIKRISGYYLYFYPFMYVKTIFYNFPFIIFVKAIRLSKDLKIFIAPYFNWKKSFIHFAQKVYIKWSFF